MFLIFQESPLQTKKSISLIELIISSGLGAQIIIGVLFILLLEFLLQLHLSIQS